MKEIEDIIKAYDIAQESGLKSALATVVNIEGSSYRRPGARMLITEDGKLTGAISGGCIEGDARRKALFAIGQGQNRLITYDSMDEEGELLGIQLGCNGIVHLLLEPILPENPYHPITFLRRVSNHQVPSCLATFFHLNVPQDQQIGTCFLLQSDATVIAKNLDGAIEELQSDAQRVILNQAAAKKEYLFFGTPQNAFLDYIPPPVSLVIAGAGNDTLPVVQMAYALGWDITVIDGRATYATPKRFPHAHTQVVKSGEKPPYGMVYVLMSHNYNYDLAILRRIINTDCAYIGILGPKQKQQRMIADLKSENSVNPALQHEKIFGPAGLDLGAETAEEIALSIIAEIKAVLSHKNAQPLRNKTDFIHSRASI